MADLAEAVREPIGTAIAGLAEDPRPPASSALKSTLKGSRRLWVGDHRVGYQVDGRAHVVTVWIIGHRSKFYDKARRRVQRMR